MFTKLRLAILCLLIPAILTSTCEDFVSRQEQRTYLKDFSNLTPEETAFKDFSGNGIGEFSFGNQDECLANPNMHYFMTVKRFQFKEGFTQPTLDEHAVCLPRDCSILLHTTNDPLLLRIYGVRNYNAFTGPPLVDVQFQIYDPSQNIKSKSFLFYFTCAFILLFVFLSIGSTIVLYNRSRKILIVEMESPQRKEQKRFDWLLKSFDLKANLIGLYQTAAEQKQNQNIAIFQFLRILTSYWVIYYHTMIVIRKRFDKPKTQPELDYHQSLISEIQRAGDLTVEYFFMMTGFLGAYTLVPKLSKEGFRFMTYINIIKHRILRVRPLYIVALLVMWQVTPFLTTGPRWHLAELNGMICDKIWWRNILMVDNLFNIPELAKNGGYCFLYGWYLSAEFQIYLVAILAFAVYAKYRKLGYLLVIVLILQSFITAIIIHFNNHMDMFHYTYQKFIWSLSKLKYMPYARWYTLFIGALWGLHYYEYNKLKKKNLFWFYETKPLISYLTMICGALLNLYMIFGLHFIDSSTLSENMRLSAESLQMLLFTVSITMIFMPLMSNRSFYLKSFMNLRIFQILGKTSYAVYLFQIDFIWLLEWTTVERFAFSYERIVWEAVKIIAATQAFGFFAHIFLEKPMLNLETHLTAPTQDKKILKDSKSKIEMQPHAQDERRLLAENARSNDLEVETMESAGKESKTGDKIKIDL